MQSRLNNFSLALLTGLTLDAAACSNTQDTQKVPENPIIKTELANCTLDKPTQETIQATQNWISSFFRQNNLPDIIQTPSAAQTACQNLTNIPSSSPSGDVINPGLECYDYKGNSPNNLELTPDGLPLRLYYVDDQILPGGNPQTILYRLSITENCDPTTLQFQPGTVRTLTTNGVYQIDRQDNKQCSSDFQAAQIGDKVITLCVPPVFCEVKQTLVSTEPTCPINYDSGAKAFFKEHCYAACDLAPPNPSCKAKCDETFQ